MLCFACNQPLLDDQPYERVYSADRPYRHARAADCPALRGDAESEPETAPADAQDPRPAV